MTPQILKTQRPSTFTHKGRREGTLENVYPDMYDPREKSSAIDPVGGRV